MAVILPNQNSKTTTAGKAPAIAKANVVTPTIANQKGGLDYNTATAQQKSDMQNNWQQVVSDPTKRASEVARATQVQADREAAGLNTSEQDAYLAKLAGIAKPATPAAAPSANPTTGYIQQMRDLAVNNAQAQAYDARNQTDAVNLQNAKGLQELMANGGLGASGDNITATLNQGAQRVNSINQINNQLSQNINNLDINMAQQLQQQYNLDEDRALQVAQLMGQYKGQDTLAKNQQLWGQKMDMAGLLGTVDGKRTLQGIASDQNVKSNNLNAALQVGQQTGYNVTPQDDWAGLFRQVTTGTNSQGTPLTQTAQQKQQDIDNKYRDEQAKIQNAFQNRQITADEARLALAQLQSDRDETYRYAGLELDMQNGSGSGGGGQDYNGLTTNQVVDNIKSNYMIMNDDGDKVMTSDPKAREQMFLDAYNSAPAGADPRQIWTALGLTQDEIKQWKQKYPETANFNSPSLTSLGGVLSNSGDSFTKYANKYGIDPMLLAAISMWETGNGTSSMAKNKNNVGGMYDSKNKTFYSFDSLDAGIEAMAKNLAKNYFSKGLTTIPQIGNKYAPSGAANDPNGLNNNWVKGVTQMYNKLKGGN